MLAGLVVLHGAHRDLAVGGVGALGDDLGIFALALDELEGELGVLQDMLRLERAVALVGNGGLDGVGLAVVSDAVVGVTRDLAQRVGVLAGLVVLHGAHRDLAVGGVGALGDDLGIFALALDELEGELAVLEGAAGQGLGRGDLIGDAELVRIRLVGVLELGLARDLFNVSLKPTRGLNRYGHFERGDVIAVGDATQLALDLADLIGVLTRLVVGDLAEVDSRVVPGHSRVRGRRHRSVILGRRGELKLKLIGSRPIAALEHLGQAKVGLGIHRCRRHIKADLAVVAQVNVNLRGVVVPLGVEHVIRGTGAVAAHTLLGGVEFVNKGKACGSLLERQVSARVAHEGVLRARGVFAGKLDNGSTGFGLSVRARCLKLILVVIGAVGIQRALRWRRAVLIRVNGGLLLEIVIAVGVGGFKVRDRITQLAIAPLVRVEANDL